MPRNLNEIAKLYAHEFGFRNPNSKIPKMKIQSKIQYDAKEGTMANFHALKSSLEGGRLFVVFSTGNIRTKKIAQTCAESGFSDSGFEIIDGLGQVLAYCQANIQ
jgi:hypothetical protein